MAIPTVVVEEHHEALLAWCSARQQRLLPEEAIALVHVDEHSDLRLPRFRTPLPHVTDDRSAWRDFVYGQVGIAEFIAPSVFLGLVDDICWVSASNHTREKKEGVVCSHRGERLVLQPAASCDADAGSDGRGYRLVQQSLTDPIPSYSEWLLDIDLDFFSNAEAVQCQSELEITAAAYEQFLAAPYHFLKLNWGSQMSVSEREGRFFLCYNHYSDPHPSGAGETKAVILARAEQLKRRLATLEVPPRLITVCRSRISGFTPAPQVDFIEETLFGKLREIYELRILLDSFLQAD